VFSSCDARGSFFLSRKTKDDPRSHPNQHESKLSCLELDPTFEAKLWTSEPPQESYGPRGPT
jgi:hypothetical protein